MVRKGILSEEDIQKKIKKGELLLKGLRKIEKLQKKFQVGKPTGVSRSTIKRRILGSRNLTEEAKREIKIFSLGKQRSIRGLGEKELFVGAIPKGIKILKKRRTRKKR